jgi:HEAT repeat protein
VFYLSQALKDRDRSVRSAILRALAQVNSPEAQEILHTTKHTVSIPNYSVSNIKDFGEESDFTTIQG